MFVYCGQPGGCDNGYGTLVPTLTCTLKHQDGVNSGERPTAYARGSQVPFVSGELAASACSRQIVIPNGLIADSKKDVSILPYHPLFHEQRCTLRLWVLPEYLPVDFCTYSSPHSNCSCNEVHFIPSIVEVNSGKRYAACSEVSGIKVWNKLDV